MDTPEDCVNIQNDLKRLEKLAKRNSELPQMEVQKILWAGCPTRSSPGVVSNLFHSIILQSLNEFTLFKLINRTESQ